MSKLPAAGAILAIAVLAAAAPAAQGRRVLVAVERDGHSPVSGVRSGSLPDGSPTYLRWLFIVHWDATNSTFVTRQIRGEAFEHVTFAPIDLPSHLFP